MTASSWSPVDLVPYLRGEQIHELPVLVQRTDGKPILYAGRLTWLSGPPESVKSWFALITCVEAMKFGRHVLYVDFETGAGEIIERLRALGATDPMIAEFFH